MTVESSENSLKIQFSSTFVGVRWPTYSGIHMAFVLRAIFETVLVNQQKASDFNLCLFKSALNLVWFTKSNSLNAWFSGIMNLFQNKWATKKTEIFTIKIVFQNKADAQKFLDEWMYSRIMPQSSFAQYGQCNAAVLKKMRKGCVEEEQMELNFH